MHNGPKKGPVMEASITEAPRVERAGDTVAEAHHRIANSLALLVSLLHMQAAGVARGTRLFEPGEVRRLLDSVAARIDTIGQLHRLLSQVPFEGVTDLNPHLKTITGALVSALGSAEQRIEVVHAGQGAVVPTRQLQPIFLILCEVFINAMKYAHPDGAAVIVRVDCGVGDDGRPRLSVSDNGAGLPDGLDPSAAHGLGFRVMRSLAAEIEAELRFESSRGGLGICLTLPPCRH